MGDRGPPISDSTVRRYRPWTDGDSVRLRDLVSAGCTDRQIGHELDRHPELIRQKRNAANLKPGVSPALRAMMARINASRMAAA